MRAVGATLEDGGNVGVLAICRALSFPLAAVRLVSLRIRRPDIVGPLGSCQGGAWAALARIQFSYLSREWFKLLLRAGLENAVLRRIRFPDGPEPATKGCIFAVWHSPWHIPLARWLDRRKIALVLTSAVRARWVGEAHVAASRAGLCQLVRELRRGRRATVAIDLFVDRDGFACQILGRPAQLSTTVARLAVAADVPIVPVAYTCKGGDLVGRFGPAVWVQDSPEGEAGAMRNLHAFFAESVALEPASWEPVMKFLRGKGSDEPSA